jgi:hypothetical protein
VSVHLWITYLYGSRDLARIDRARLELTKIGGSLQNLGRFGQSWRVLETTFRDDLGICHKIKGAV